MMAGFWRIFRSGGSRTPFRELPRPVQIYTVASVVAYGVAAWLLPLGRPVIVLGLVAVFAGAGLVQPASRHGGGIAIPNLALIVITLLLWSPQEVLLGIGFGSFLGLIILRGAEPWRAILNGTLTALPAAAGAWATGQVIPAGASREAVVPLILAAVVAVAIYGLLHIGLLAGYHNLRFRHAFFADWLYNIGTNPASQLISTPLAVVLAGVVAHLRSDAWGLAATATCGIFLPLVRQELVYYHQSQQILEEIVETVIRVLDRIMPGAREHSERVSAIAVEAGRRLGLSEQALMTLRLAARLHDIGILTGANLPLELQVPETPAKKVLDQLPDRMIAAIVDAHHERWADREGHGPQRRTVVSLAGSILAAAELYDSARAGLRPFDRALSRESVERELAGLAGSMLDPEVLPVVLRVGRELSGELASTAH